MDWVPQAIDELLASGRPDGGWSYATDGRTLQSMTEPTALVAMALGAHGVDAGGAVDWLLAAQRADGGFAVGPEHDESAWVTAPGCLALQSAGRVEAAARAARWLLRIETFTFRWPPWQASPYGFDTTLGAWPWTNGDVSWVEPTAWAVMALRSAGWAQDPAVDRGRRFLLDRAADDGVGRGWNYGEPMVLGTRLSPAVASTAMALLALRGLDADPTSALEFLEQDRRTQSSLYSLAWAANAMAAFGRGGGPWTEALAAAYPPDPWRGSDRVISLALALLAVAAPEKNPLIIS